MLRNVSQPTGRDLPLVEEPGDHSERQQDEDGDDQDDQRGGIQLRHLPSGVGRSAGSRTDPGPDHNLDKAAVNAPNIRLF
jgi:hypothetical protein